MSLFKNLVDSVIPSLLTMPIGRANAALKDYFEVEGPRTKIPKRILHGLAIPSVPPEVKKRIEQRESLRAELEKLIQLSILESLKIPPDTLMFIEGHSIKPFKKAGEEEPEDKWSLWQMFGFRSKVQEKPIQEIYTATAHPIVQLGPRLAQLVDPSSNLGVSLKENLSPDFEKLSKDLVNLPESLESLKSRVNAIAKKVDTIPEASVYGSSFQELLKEWIVSNTMVEVYRHLAKNLEEQMHHLSSHIQLLQKASFDTLISYMQDSIELVANLRGLHLTSKEYSVLNALFDSLVEQNLIPSSVLITAEELVTLLVGNLPIEYALEKEVQEYRSAVPVLRRLTNATFAMFTTMLLGGFPVSILSYLVLLPDFRIKRRLKRCELQDETPLKKEEPLRLRGE